MIVAVCMAHMPWPDRGLLAASGAENNFLIFYFPVMFSLPDVLEPFLFSFYKKNVRGPGMGCPGAGAWPRPSWMRDLMSPQRLKEKFNQARFLIIWNHFDSILVYNFIICLPR